MAKDLSILLVGIGNEYRGDDAAGLLIARKLREQLPHALEVIEQSGEGAALLESWENAESVILVDAVQSGAAAGTIHRFEAHAQALPSNFFHYSTHAFSVAEAVELARALNRLPPLLVVYGIEGKNFAHGAPLSSEVESAIAEAVVRIQHEAEAMTRLTPAKVNDDA